MRTTKSGQLGLGGTPTPAQLEKINRQSKAELRAEDVYCFSVRLCDDQPDRDNERFAAEALPKLAALFIGKTGICDHEWSAQGQVARIFDAWCEHDGEATILRAWAYMLRGAQTDPVIAMIEGGIRREVSVGCAMGADRCSICGEPYGTCEHQKGTNYGGQLCCRVLDEPLDAYEFSFVAVPAQPKAGVLKRFPDDGAQEALQKRAELGDRYLASLRAKSVKLALSLGLEVERGILERMAAPLDEAELLALGEALGALRDRKFPQKTQLSGPGPRLEGLGSEFLI